MTPKRHKFIVELTDMELGWSEREARNHVESALDRGIYEIGLTSFVANVQVKSYRRVEAAYQRRSKNSAKC